MITVIISVFNEENRILPCLQSFWFADRILLLDKKSTDNTILLASKFRNVEIAVLENESAFNVSEVSILLSKVEHGWVIFATASDLVHPKLAIKLRDFALSDVGNYNAVDVPYKSYFQGFYGKSSPWFITHTIKMARRECYYISEGSVHNTIRLTNVKTHKLRFKNQDIAFYHLTHESLDGILGRFVRYLLGERGNIQRLRNLRRQVLIEMMKVIWRTRFFTRNSQIISVNLVYLSYKALEYVAVYQCLYGNSKLVYDELRSSILKSDAVTEC